MIVPYNVLYLDWMQVTADQADVNEGYRGGWGDGSVNSVEKIYNFDPLARLRSVGKTEFGLGVQGNMWTETTNNNAELEYQLLPRLLAISEIGWLPNNQKDWLSFFYRLQQHSVVFEDRKMTYAKHFFLKESKTPLQEKVDEAEKLLADTRPSEVGYTSKATCDALANAVTVAKAAAATEEAQQVEAMTTALATFKAAPITQPVAGKVYRLISASTYYKAKYAGATLYADGTSAVKVHYTDQQAPEELFTFVEANGGWIMQSVHNKQEVTISSYNQPLRFVKKNATPIRIDRAAVPAQQYDYVPGAVVLSKVQGYNATATGSVGRFYIKSFGGNRNNDEPSENKVVAFDQPTLCHPGTWYIEEANFQKMLAALLQRCDHAIEDVVPNEEGQHTQVAIQQLQKDLAPARDLVAKQAAVSQEVYETYVKAYEKFLAAPKTTAVEALTSNHYYVIRSAHPQMTGYVAQLKDGLVVPTKVEAPVTTDENPTILWQLIRQEDGNFVLMNKAEKKYAVVRNASSGESIVENSTPYAWHLRYRKTNDISGFLIMAGTSNYGWYLPSNPVATTRVSLRIANQWNNYWKLEPTAVPTGLDRSPLFQEATGTTYDLSGRVATPHQRGVVIDAAGHKQVR